MMGDLEELVAAVEAAEATGGRTGEQEAGPAGSGAAAVAGAARGGVSGPSEEEVVNFPSPEADWGEESSGDEAGAAGGGGGAGAADAVRGAAWRRAERARKRALAALRRGETRQPKGVGLALWKAMRAAARLAQDLPTGGFGRPGGGKWVSPRGGGRGVVGGRELGQPAARGRVGRLGGSSEGGRPPQRGRRRGRRPRPPRGPPPRGRRQGSRRTRRRPGPRRGRRRGGQGRHAQRRRRRQRHPVRRSPQRRGVTRYGRPGRRGLRRP